MAGKTRRRGFPHRHCFGRHAPMEIITKTIVSMLFAAAFTLVISFATYKRSVISLVRGR
jgi:hypothetical protein